MKIIFERSIFLMAKVLVMFCIALGFTTRAWAEGESSHMPSLGQDETQEAIQVPTAQSRPEGATITGVVLDQDNLPLSGAYIRIKGTGNVTVANAKGEFSIKVPTAMRSKKSIVVTISFIGMVTQDVEWKGKPIRVKMKDDVNTLGDVVVTGYQTIDRRSLSSSITTLDMEEILVPGMPTLDVALEGRVPDLVFSANSGNAGATGRVRIRGTSTILGNREPLWVVDGFVVTDPVQVSNEDLNNPDYINIIGNAIAGINPQDIARIDVLKDASATALYGTQAANGVIVVTTKQGREGPPSIKLDTQLRFSKRPSYTDRGLNLMTSAERVEFGRNLVDMHYIFPSNMPLVGYEGAYMEYMNKEIDFDTFIKKTQYYAQVNTDWFDLLTEDAYSPNSTLTVSGGSKKIRYYVSLGYNNDKGVTKREKSDRYTMRSSLNVNLSDKLKLNVGISGNMQKKFHNTPEISVVNFAYYASRAIPAFNADGTYYMYKARPYNVGGSYDQFSYNIMNDLDNSHRLYNGHGMSVNTMLTYEVTPSLRLQLGGSINRSSTTQETWWGEQSTYVAQLRNAEYGEIPLKGDSGKSELPFGGILNTNMTNNQSWTVRFQPDYRKVIDNKHIISVSLGLEARSNNYNSFNDNLYGYMRDRGMKFVSEVNLDDYPHYKNWLNRAHRTLSHNVSNHVSSYLTASYSLGYHFTINANGRVDYSNKFGSRANERFLPIWSVSGTYNASENILKGVKGIDELRLRASYGSQGNVPDAYPTLVMRKGPLSPYYNQYTSTIVGFPNPNLRWEETDQVNVALEAGFLKNRLRFTVEGYYKHTKDAFIDVAVSSVNGVNQNRMNGGTLINKGMSISVFGVPLKTKDWYGTISGYASKNLNRVTTGTVETFNWQDYLTGRAILDGYPISTFFSYKYTGLNPVNGAPMFDDYMDRQHLLKDRSLEEIVRMVMEDSGQRDPLVTGGFSTSLSYKDFSLSANFSYSIGSKMRLFGLYNRIFGGVSSDQNLRRDFLERWRAPGDEEYTNYPAIISTAHPDFLSYVSHFSNAPGMKQFAENVWDMYDKSNLRVVPGDYLRLSSVSFRYRLSNDLIQKWNLPLSAASISLNGTNLYTLSSKVLKGQDPSQAGFDVPQMSIRPNYTIQLSLTY